MSKTGKILPQFRSIALVAVGSNRSFGEDDPALLVNSALENVGRSIGVIRSQSALYRTPAYPVGSGPDFVNAAIAIDTNLDPETILERLHRLEIRSGRERRTRWSARTLDLDLIALNDVVWPDLETYNHWKMLPPEQQQVCAPEQLVLPHPRMHERAFVLLPLLDVAPDWLHPATGKTVTEMAAALPGQEKEGVRRL